LTAKVILLIEIKESDYQSRFRKVCNHAKRLKASWLKKNSLSHYLNFLWTFLCFP